MTTSNRPVGMGIAAASHTARTMRWQSIVLLLVGCATQTLPAATHRSVEKERQANWSPTPQYLLSLGAHSAN